MKAQVTPLTAFSTSTGHGGHRPDLRGTASPVVGALGRVDPIVERGMGRRAEFDIGLCAEGADGHPA
jgi:hypothetical protein